MPFTRNSNLSDAYHETIAALSRLPGATSENLAALQYLQDEIEYLEEFSGPQGTAHIAGTGNLADDLKVIRYALGNHALALEKLIPRLSGLLESLKGLAGKTALADAAKPTVGTRGQ
jgi:hypothetical protein